jgi:hypothetical protein
LLRGPGDEPLRVNRAGEVGVKVAALRHSIKKCAQRGVIIARRFEVGCRDDGVEFAGEQGNTQQENEGGQEDDGKDDPASQGLPPLCSLQREASGHFGEMESGRATRSVFSVPRLRGRVGEGVTGNALPYCVPLPVPPAEGGYIRLRPIC